MTLTVDAARNRVFCGDREVVLSRIEYRLLSYLARHRGFVMTNNQLIDHVWPDADMGDHHLLHSTVNRLRRKLRDMANGEQYVITRRGIGYGIGVK